MRRFTLTLAMVTIVAFAFGQRSATQAEFSRTSSIHAKTLKQYNGEKSTNLTTVWEELFTDSGLTASGLPANFVYTPTSTLDADQWRWRSDGVIGRGWYEDKQISESFTTDAHTVPANNPALFLDFQCSYYWAIANGTDSLEVSYSIDAGTTWTRLWSNRNQALVEASGIAWPYPSWVYQTARIALPATTIGQDMMFKFIYEGGTANGIAIDKMSMVEIPNNDIEMNSAALLNTYLADNDTSYFDGIYQLLPISMKQNFEYAKAAVKNYGMSDAMGLNFKNSFTNASGTVIAQKDTNYMTSNSQDLLGFLTVDTFICEVGFAQTDFDAVVEGTYTLDQSVFATYTTGNDEDSTNNEFTIDITYDAAVPTVYTAGITHLARNTKGTGSMGLHQYENGAEGDQLGISFHVFETCAITGAMIPLATTTTDGTGFTVKVYFYNKNVTPKAWEQIAYSDDYYASAADGGTTVSVDLISPVELQPSVDYMMVVAPHWTAGTSKIAFDVYNDYKDFQGDGNSLLYAPASSLNLGGTWYYMTNIPTFTAILAAPLAVNQVNALENEMVVYPNPTNGTLHIDNVNGATVEVYNMVGMLVNVINNASEFNTVDLSNNADGTYLVKVYTETGVAVKKVNLVK